MLLLQLCQQLLSTLQSRRRQCDLSLCVLLLCGHLGTTTAAENHPALPTAETISVQTISVQVAPVHTIPAQTIPAHTNNSPATSTIGNEPGQSPFPIWSPLTDFEIDTLTSIQASHDPDASELLAFYLVASGDVRDRDTFHLTQAKIELFLNSHAKTIRKQRSQEKKGAMLLEFMHREFFLGGGETPELPGYSLNQTQLSEIFRTGQYNCISSALLYIVLAKAIGLEVQGVLMPSHAFVALRTNSGRVIDIETTSPNGFDIPHDEAFYSDADGGWFDERALVRPTYADYLQRTVISAFELGAENLWSQHTHSGTMDEENRARLIEIKAHLQPKDEITQVNRLVLYHTFFNEQLARRDLPMLAHFYTTIADYLGDLRYSGFSSSNFTSAFLSVNLGHAYTLMHTGSLEQALRKLETLFPQFDSDLPNHADLLNNYFVITNTYIEDRIQQADFAAARSVYLGKEYLCVQHPVCSQSLANLYAKWAASYWQVADWQNVIEVVRDYLSIDNQLDEQTSFTANMESAYLNWAQTALGDEEWQTALSILQTCQQESPLAKRCRQRHTELEQKARRYNY